MLTLDLQNKDIKTATHELETLIEQHQEENESEDYLILTNDHKVQGAILALIDSLELEHNIELGGKIYVTLE